MVCCDSQQHRAGHSSEQQSTKRGQRHSNISAEATNARILCQDLAGIILTAASLERPAIMHTSHRQRLSASRNGMISAGNRAYENTNEMPDDVDITTALLSVTIARVSL